MTQREPNYRELSPPEDTDPADYSWAERRAELYDMIERAGHYRNLQRSQRELARRYDVSTSTVNKDIRKVNAWIAERLGENAEAELETLKNRAVQKLIDEGDEDKAFYLMKNYWETLLESGAKERAPEEVDMNHSGEVGGSGSFDVSITHHRVTDDEGEGEQTAPEVDDG